MEFGVIRVSNNFLIFLYQKRFVHMLFINNIESFSCSFIHSFSVQLFSCWLPCIQLLYLCACHQTPLACLVQIVHQFGTELKKQMQNLFIFAFLMFLMKFKIQNIYYLQNQSNIEAKLFLSNNYNN